MQTIQRIVELLNHEGIAPSRMCRDLGFSSGLFTQWKKGSQNPSMSKLKQVADYLDVSVDFLLGNTDIKKEPVNILPVGDLVSLPVIASVRAGYGGTAVESWEEDMETIPLSMLRGYSPNECRLFKVKGDSMYPRILDGDLILVHVQPSVDSGDITVIIYNDDEVTIKKVRYITGEDWLELIPANPEYQVKRIEGADLEKCHVFGKIIGLYRANI